MIKKPFASINILNYNNKDTIIPCLESALNQDYENIEVCLIDNNSKDKSLELIKSKFKNHSKLKIIENKKNVGFAEGHNQAIRETKGELINCLNSDAILAKDFLSKAIPLFKNRKIGAVQGKLLSYNFETNQPRKKQGKKIIDTVGLAILKNRRIINQAQGESDSGQYNKNKIIWGADGAAPVYRRKALQDIKINNEYFDKDFFIYKEDVDLAWRMLLYGWQTIYEPQATAYHGRTAGESAAISYFNIVKERRKIKSLPKYYSFRNQRLMQIKNELPLSFLKNFHRWLLKEICSWFYILIFEPKILKCSKDLISQIPVAFKKRKIIQKNKKANRKEIDKWFK